MVQKYRKFYVIPGVFQNNINNSPPEQTIVSSTFCIFHLPRTIISELIVGKPIFTCTCPDKVCRNRYFKVYQARLTRTCLINSNYLGLNRYNQVPVNTRSRTNIQTSSSKKDVPKCTHAFFRILCY